MIELHTYATPNGKKVSIALEEMALPYEVRVVDLTRGEQLQPAFLAINPNNKIPAIVDHDVAGAPLVLWESGAILTYLADKTGKLLPADVRGRAAVMQWLMFQMSAVGPTFGHLSFFARAADKLPAAIARFYDDTVRILRVMDHRLEQQPYLAGEYSIADIATFPWIRFELLSAAGDLPELANLRRWHAEIAARPAVQRGMTVPVLPAKKS